MTAILDDAASAAGCCPASQAVPVAFPDEAVTGAGQAGTFAQTGEDGRHVLSLLVDGITCAACIAHVEKAARSVPGVEFARLNYSTRRLQVGWQENSADADSIVTALAARGYKATPYAPEGVSEGDDAALKTLLRALGVAGFAAMNVMLLSVSLWAGSDMAPETRLLFQWLSALIVLPAIAYAGQPFFRAALSALRGGRLNMDVPISLAIILAATMSLYQTITGGDEIYFDASIMLLFFLLLGRTLDLRVRAKARSAAQNLLAMRSRAATVIRSDGTREFLQAEHIRPGMTLAVASGERIPADGTLSSATATLDTSLLTGETLPESARSGATVFAGSLNIGDPLELVVTAAADATLLSEIVRLMEVAEQGRARYVRLADRVAAWYAPVVHGLGAITVLAWLWSGAGWETALLNGIAVLIITCPCALGLAVPAVQVVAGGRLLRAGILIKSGDALERLADVDTVVFDKTGTLTTGALQLADPDRYDEATMALATALAQESRHPLSRALTAAGRSHPATIRNIRETSGFGLSGEIEAGEIRLGSRTWVGAGEDAAPEDTQAEIWLRDAAGNLTRFTFDDELRRDAVETVSRLRQYGMAVILLSGDRTPAVRAIAETLGIRDWRAGCLPQNKAARLTALSAEGRKVLMVGDGLNDAPALATAHVSMSPADAADIAQVAADFISLGDRLGAVCDCLTTARQSRRLVWQNFALAFGYNAIAIPLAITGFVTPLIAAIAMSGSSIIVTLNALRLKWMS